MELQQTPKGRLLQHNSLESHKRQTMNLISNPGEIMVNDKPCVYCIENLRDGKKYIGSTINFKRRASEYIRYINNLPAYPKLHNKPIIKAMAAEGLDMFTMYPILVCDDRDDLPRLELDYILKLNTFYPNGYNDTFVTQSREPRVKSRSTMKRPGIKPSADTRRKKSRPVAAINTETKHVIFSESLKLLANMYFHKDRAILSHVAMMQQTAYGYYLIYMDEDSEEIAMRQLCYKYERMKGRQSGTITDRDKEYLEIAQAVADSDLDYFKSHGYKMEKLIFHDDADVYGEFIPVE